VGEFSIVASGPASVNFTRTIILPKSKTWKCLSTHVYLVMETSSTPHRVVAHLQISIWFEKRINYVFHTVNR
jgi:hypothetical protein